MSSFNDVRPICWQCGGDLKFNDDWDKPWCPVHGSCDIGDIAVPHDIYKALLELGRKVDKAIENGAWVSRADQTEVNNFHLGSRDAKLLFAAHECLAAFSELPGGE